MCLFSCSLKIRQKSVVTNSTELHVNRKRTPAFKLTSHNNKLLAQHRILIESHKNGAQICTDSLLSHTNQTHRLTWQKSVTYFDTVDTLITPTTKSATNGAMGVSNFTIQIGLIPVMLRIMDACGAVICVKKYAVNSVEHTKLKSVRLQA